VSKIFVAVEKEATFQGRTERWANVYCYEVTDNSTTALAALETAVLDAEKPVPSSAGHL
jgi:hypothetical protein